MYTRACVNHSFVNGCALLGLLCCWAITLLDEHRQSFQSVAAFEHNLVLWSHLGVGRPMTYPRERKKGAFFFLWLSSYQEIPTPKKTDGIFLGKNSQKAF